MTSCDCGSGDRQGVDLGVHVERDRARLVQGHVVVAGGLVGIDIHASAGVVRHRAVGPPGTLSIQADGLLQLKFPAAAVTCRSGLFCASQSRNRLSGVQSTDVAVLAPAMSRRD